MKCYTNETENEILKKANQSIGLTINEILKTVNLTINLKNKGNIGNIIEEYWFGIKNNNSPLPDFEKEGIELKIIPLIKNKKNSYSVKERTKICSIDYTKLIEEKWESSHAKTKLDKILFIYYVYNKDNITNSFIKKIDLFKINQSNESIIKDDWTRVHKLVSDGEANNISESISNILAASRSGSGGKKADGTLKDLVAQPHNQKKALKRAFSLKQSFTNQRWNELNNEKYESIIEVLNTNSKNFEKDILCKINELKDFSLEKIAKKFNIKVPQGKNAAATIIKKAIGFKNVSSRIKEFEQLGITVKIISVRKNDGVPLEAVSFPCFKLKELIHENFFEGSNSKEDWEASSLLQNINRILFIPIFRDKDKHNKAKDRILGKSFFWSPSTKEINVIEDEWNNYIKEILEGKVKITRKPHGNSYREISKLSKESSTQVIHIRPHAKNREDRDIDHLGNSIVKQSFWLNKKFLKTLITKNSK